MKLLENSRISNLLALLPPQLLHQMLPISRHISKTVLQNRYECEAILNQNEKRLVIICGPCSIHDPEAALDYAHKLKQLNEALSDELLIIMRVYFEKPRTTIGWKGLINDPKLDESFDINKGLKLARQLLLNINELGLGCGTEFLDTTIPQYIGDLISWAAIGARTSESQIHRELASGLSMPVGFKNSVTGNLNGAVDAVLSARYSHHFLGVTNEGIAAIVATKGNKACHVILRGANSGPNYSQQDIAKAHKLLAKHGLTQTVMVDCSHGNSQKNHENQINVVNDLITRIGNKEQGILGLMLESNLIEGKQSLLSPPLLYGQSITDACINFDTTKNILTKLAHALKKSTNIR
jgi:3-deoxy-7-phosphoheptulonate synthase